MTKHPRAAGWGLFLGGIGFALAFAWPLLGTMRTVFWPALTFDAPGPAEQVATRLIELSGMDAARAGIYDDYKIAIPSAGGRDCHAALTKRLESGTAFDERNEVLNAIFLYRNAAQRRRLDIIAIRTLVAIPPPLLGALGGCAEGSIVSRLCVNYVSKRVETALLSAKPQIRRDYQQDALKLQKMACIVSDGISPRSAPPRT